MKDLLRIAPEVADALAGNRPVVALESTVISHGLPFPENLATALDLESRVRAGGALPATVAVLDGRLRVGLAAADLERLAGGREPVAKLSRRDLPVALVQGGLGATTVAATMIAARLSGIRVFATGGIGGVHRGAPQSFDLSADLSELARTSVAVVCAGAKSILDLGLTLELLETLGVPVLGYRTDRFPAFYTRDSGHGVDARVESPGEAARICLAKWALGLEGGVILANPIPEAHALPAPTVEAAVREALEEARRQGVHGKATTPFLLARMKDLTGGGSLAANLALLRNNADLAAQVAVAMASGG